MESNIGKMTPEQKEYWKIVWKHMINYNKALLANKNYQGEHEYIKQAITTYEHKLTLLE